VRQDHRTPFDEALHEARVAAYPPGEYAGQESFMRAGEILDLARRAGVGPGVRVLDLCCGVAGPGCLITRELGCTYRGVDSSADALRIARERAGDLPCRFEVGEIPPVPGGAFDVVLLLETFLAFPDKDEVIRHVAGGLPAGGRFAFTVEAGRALTGPEREAMPDADTVWLVPLPELTASLGRAGLRVLWQADHTDAHREMVDALIAAFEAHAPAISARIGQRALEELLAAHRLWSTWMRSGRVRKIAAVAEKA
jgi:SAM-dependent methyltransferase